MDRSHLVFNKWFARAGGRVHFGRPSPSSASVYFTNVFYHWRTSLTPAVPGNACEVADVGCKVYGLFGVTNVRARNVRRFYRGRGSTESRISYYADSLSSSASGLCGVTERVWVELGSGAKGREIALSKYKTQFRFIDDKYLVLCRPRLKVLLRSRSLI